MYRKILELKKSFSHKLLHNLFAHFICTYDKHVLTKEEKRFDKS